MVVLGILRSRGQYGSRRFCGGVGLALGHSIDCQLGHVWAGMDHEDWRYPLVRERAGKFAVPVDFLGIHLFPTVQVFLGCLPIYAVMRWKQAELGWLDAVVVLATLGAIVIETVADLQLHAFLTGRRQGDEIIEKGLWAWSRHPNYFGELAFWWGLMFFGLAVAPSQWWWICPGALAMTAMFVFVSIPLMDQRSRERRPAYAAHNARKIGFATTATAQARRRLIKTLNDQRLEQRVLKGWPKFLGAAVN